MVNGRQSNERPFSMSRFEMILLGIIILLLVSLGAALFWWRDLIVN